MVCAYTEKLISTAKAQETQSKTIIILQGGHRPPLPSLRQGYGGRCPPYRNLQDFLCFSCAFSVNTNRLLMHMNERLKPLFLSGKVRSFISNIYSGLVNTYFPALDFHYLPGSNLATLT